MNADVVVLGMGPGGEEVAMKLAEAGLDVIGVEKELLGGECPYWACVPTKMMVRATDSLAEGQRINVLAGTSTVNRDWSLVANRIREEATDNWNDEVAVKRFEEAGGRFVRGEGRLDGTMSVVVGDDRIFVSRAIVIATGSKAVTQGISGLDTVDFWTNRGAVAATEVPSSLVVVGGGAVGCEFAQLFARFGSKVTLLEGEPHILPREEPEACRLLHDVFARDGIDVRAGQVVTMCGREGGGVVVTLKDGATVTGDRLLLAIGRRVDLAAIGASTIGIDENARAVPVDDHLRVEGAPGVWAIGDVAGGGLTHMAMHHARIAIADILNHETPGLSQRAVPRVTFTDPEVGSVGLTEKQARDQGIDVRTGSTQVRDSARGWIHKEGNDGFIKLVEDRNRRVLVGATSVGPVGGEVLSMLTLAVHTETTTDDLRHMIYAYPTFHRGVEDALRDLGS